MNMALQQIRIGLSRQQPCSYIPSKEERVAIVLEKEMHSGENFEMLLANGFRRSGNTLYKPQCDTCQACQALRVAVQDFSLQKVKNDYGQKANICVGKSVANSTKKWFELYAKYIEGRHASGSMYPPREKEFFEFADCTWLTMHYLHIYDGEDLVAIAITDILENSASAFYTFFDPDYELSLGTYAVLCQLEYCRQYNKQWLYLAIKSMIAPL